MIQGARVAKDKAATKRLQTFPSCSFHKRIKVQHQGPLHRTHTKQCDTFRRGNTQPEREPLKQNRWRFGRWHDQGQRGDYRNCRHFHPALATTIFVVW
jgi:hypothetical protein